MCLTLRSTFSFKRIALTDIKCYKFLDNNRGELTTPYMDSPVEIGEEYKSELYKNGFNGVEIGLHSFATYEDARKKGGYCGYHTIVECVIPRGSRYYSGTFSVYKSYASNKLKYIKKL